MTLYRINNWDDHFENSESRKVKNPRWVAVPNTHDGKGYRRVVAMPDGVEIFCAWCLLLQVASKTPTRGVLADDKGEPLTAEDIGFKTGMPSAIFEKAFKALSNKSIGWIEAVQSPDEVPASPEVSGSAGAGREGKGREQKECATRSRRPSESADRDECDRIRIEDRKPDQSDPTSTNGVQDSQPLPDQASEASRSGDSKKRRSPPTGPHAELIRVFTEAWSARYGGEYPFAGGKDGQHVKTILSHVFNDLPKASDIVRRYLASNDDFYVRDRHGLGLLVSQLRRFVVPAKPSANGANGSQFRRVDL